MTFDDLLKKWNKGLARGAQSRLAERIGIRPNTVSQWGPGRPPSEDLRPKVASVLGVSVAELMALFETGSRTPSGVDLGSYAPARMVPVLGTVCAERFAFSFDAFPEEHLPIPLEPGRKLFALRISGDCMEPTLRDGDYVIMDPAGVPNEGRIVLARIDGEYTLKRYYRTPAGVELRPDNKKYQPIRSASNKLIVEAVAVHQHRRL